MKLRQLRNDDEAVSPVIGVILMVAITVILAAVIATFVLGLGDQVSSTAPQASFTFDYNGTSPDSADVDFYDASATGSVTITHAGGATLTAGNLGVSGDGVAGGPYELGTGSVFNADSELSAGDSFSVATTDSGTVRITWENEQGTDSATLREYTLPS